MLFVDGIGLGEDDARVNPFVLAELPTLNSLSGGQPWVRDAGPWESARARLLATDACLGVPGRPQSASGQAALISGHNTPRFLGEHYGPRPNNALREWLRKDNLFLRIVGGGRRAALLEAYPPVFHASLTKGKRLPASLQFAALSAGLPLRDAADLRRGLALPGDFTGEGWQRYFDSDQKIQTPQVAGQRLAQLALGYDFSLFCYWWTDVTGHRGDLASAVAQLELLDAVLAGVLTVWDTQQDLFILTSDHGNLEAMDHRKHTENDIPTLLVGAGRGAFRSPLALYDIAPTIAHLLNLPATANG